MNEYLNFPGKKLNVPIIQSNNFFKKKQRGLNEEVTLHPSSIPSNSSIPSHSYVSILVFLSKRSEEVLLIFFVFLEISKMRNRMEINL